MAIFLTHYLGFPLGSKLDGAVKGRREAQEGRGEGRGERQEGQRQRRASRCTSGGNVHDK